MDTQCSLGTTKQFLQLDARRLADYATPPLSARLASTSSTEILQIHRGPQEHCATNGRDRKCSDEWYTGLVTRQPKTPGEDMEKFAGNIFHGVPSIFPHTYIHFPSTSSLRYIARIDSMSVTRNLHFPGKYTGGGDGG